MISFKFSNISGPRKIKSTQLEKDLEKKDIEMESILDKHPSGYSIEEIVEAELINSSDEEKKELEEDLFNFLIRKNEEKREKYEKNYTQKENEEILSIKRKIENQKFDELKDILTEDYIQRCKDEYYSYNKEDKEDSYFVAIACKKLSLNYLKTLGIIADKKNIEELKKRFKEFYYNKNKREYTPPSNIRNFYEVEKPDEDEL